MKIIVAVAAASGMIYARQSLERLLSCREVERIALIYSTHARQVAAHEAITLPDDPRITLYDNDDLFASPASGSAAWDAMVIVPCTVGTLGRIAAGTAQSLIERAADVMLKERRRLVLVVRETPLSLIHLRNMTTLAECGAVILPACPSFYSHPATLEAACNTVVERVVAQLGVEVPHYAWDER
ncbi:MAG: UbiX family flavin prenyltransferase [Alistipes sp.]